MLKKGLFAGVLMALLPTIFVEAYRGLSGGAGPVLHIVASVSMLLVIAAIWGITWWLSSHKEMLKAADLFLGGAFCWVLIGVGYHELFHRPGVVALGFGVCAAIYRWYPVITGRAMRGELGVFHFWATFICAMVLFHPVADFWYRWQGYIDLFYIVFDRSVVWHFLMAVLAGVQGLLVVNLVYSAVRRRAAN